MNNKYEVIIKLLNSLKNKYSAEKVFRDFIFLFAITLSNKVCFNKENGMMYKKIYNSYEKEEQYIFYALSSELIRLLKNEDTPYDILGDIYRKICTNKNIKLLHFNKLDEVGRKLQGVMKLDKKNNIGKMLEVNCGSGGMILAYACSLSLFNLDYKIDLDVTAVDTDILNVFMTYIQLYFYEISAVVILLDKVTNKELMRLYTPNYENDIGNQMVA